MIFKAIELLIKQLLINKNKNFDSTCQSRWEVIIRDHEEVSEVQLSISDDLTCSLCDTVLTYKSLFLQVLLHNKKY